ncbi:MAG TPA: Gfo/Idh/MocA family oxidoreductase [Microlunatus sp.]
MLRSLVIGCGWAGEGYVNALRAAAVEVALCGRSPEPARAAADRLGVAELRLDWASAIDELRPDIVAIATPGGSHRAIADHAAARGCHVICEKPLGRDADEAAGMLAAVRSAGVRHAYGANTRYADVLVQARDLLAAGAIGDLREIEVVDHFDFPPLMPYSWLHSLAEGGGMLFNVYPHVLAQAQFVSGGRAAWAFGLAERVLDRVPVGSPVHDFRAWAPMTEAEAAGAEWRQNDADLAATVITGIELPDGRQVRALFHASAFGAGRHPGYLALYGTEGTLHLLDQPWFSGLQLRRASDDRWEDIPVAAVDDRIQAGWNRLVAEFVADVAGEGGGGYPTFDDGLLANQLIDQVRAAGAQPSVG